MKTDKKRLFVGFDGGGTRSRLFIGFSPETSQYQEYSKSVKYTDLGVEAAATQLADLIAESTSNDWDELSITLCLSGASNPTKNEEFKATLARIFSGRTINCHIESDSSFTLAAAYPDAESGLLVIAGTGSVVIGRDKEGAIHKVGGWGRLLGDEGSGYWLGLQALKYYVKAIDSQKKEGLLFEAVHQSIIDNGISDPLTLRAVLYSGKLNPSSFAPVLFSTISDPESKKILSSGVISLVEQISMLETKTTFETRLTFHGSVAEQPLYQEAFNDILGNWYSIKVLSGRQLLEYAYQRAVGLPF